MSVEQALQVLAQATENLPTTRSHHAQISQALMTLQALVNQAKMTMTQPAPKPHAVPKPKEEKNAQPGK